MDLAFHCAPRFDYARAQHELQITEHGAVFSTPASHAHPARGSGPRAARPRRPCRASVRANETIGVVLEAGVTAAPPRPVTEAEVQQLLRRHRPLLATLAPAVHLPWSLARDGRPLGDDSQAHDLCANGGDRWLRRPRRCPSSSAASATGTTATRGSATARTRSVRCWRSASKRKPSAFLVWLRDRIEEQVGTSIRTAQDHVPRRRLFRPHTRRHSTTSRATAARDRYGSATAPPTSSSSTSTVKRSTPSARLTARVTGSAMPAGRPSPDRRTGSRTNWDQPDEGIWETRGGRSDFIYGRVMSWVALDGRCDWPRARAAGALGSLEGGARRESTSRCSPRAGVPPTGVRPVLRRRRPRRVAPGDADHRLRRAQRPEVAVDARCHRARPGLRQPRVPLRPRARLRTACAVPKAPSRSAPSGTSTPWPGRAAGQGALRLSKRC